MTDYLELSARCESLDKPDRETELAIWRLRGGTCPPGKQPLSWLHCYTQSLDAALSLVGNDVGHQIMLEAALRLQGKILIEHGGWPDSISYKEQLARYVTAAALRHLDPVDKSIKVSVDLGGIEVSDEILQAAETSSWSPRFSPEERLAIAWNLICSALMKNGAITGRIDAATPEMLAAGRTAYERKVDDMQSVSPTEHPEDGGGPLGYAWRAMVKAKGR